MGNKEIDLKRRKFLLGSTVALGGIGVAAASVPFLSSMLPNAKTQAAGVPIEVDVSQMKEGEQLTVEWRGKPVWIVRRTQAQLATLKLTQLIQQLRDPNSKLVQQPPYADNEYRSINPEYLVLIGVCTHLGCSPTYRPDVGAQDLGADWEGGFFCSCHGSRFDMAGRVFKHVPAPTNLVVPPYTFIRDKVILIGAGSSKETEIESV